MRKAPKEKKGSGFINILFLVVVIWIVWGLHQQGTFDKLIKTFQGGHTFTSIEGTTCDELKESAIGRELTNSLTEEAKSI